MDSDEAGHDLIRTDLAAPFDFILLRRKRARKIKQDLPVVTSPDIEDYADLPDTFTLEWESLGLIESLSNTPEKVRDEWRDQFKFRTEDPDSKLPGLRAPQIGALHAISAHFSIGAEFEPATVVLPTGTGKTETMLATTIYRRLKKTLVVVPSDALRSQISQKFVSLGVLPKVGVIERNTFGPHVAILSKAIRSVDDAKALAASANVIVALPNVLSASSSQAVEYLLGECSDLIVDEAHHITAKTWAAVRDRFDAKRILQFTATPFRQDGAKLDGKIIFNFKLGDAQEANYYKPINLVEIEEYGDQNARDKAIAEKAVVGLRADRDIRGLDHILMARTKSRERADEVLKLYQELAPDLRPISVYSGPGTKTANRETIAKLQGRSTDAPLIIVCVDMLGEGFDLPNLKVAALHDTHKSLAITLQFIGRFTRTGNVDQIGDATVIANIADPGTEEKLSGLYAAGADWDRIIRRLSEERIDEELKLQDVVLRLKEQGGLHDQVSLWNLRPSLSTQFFRTGCSDWQPLAYKDVLPRTAESWYSLDVGENILVAVVCRSNRVNWGDYQNIEDTVFDLLIARWDKVRSVLAIYVSDQGAFPPERLVKAITGLEPDLVAGTPIFNILNNVELPLVKNLGSSRVGAISFTSYFGPNVTEGLARIEKSESELNNIACLGYEDGEKVLWGGTQKRGKIWQRKNGSIAEWLAWVDRTWKKVDTETTDSSNITRDFLRPQKLSKPHGSYPIGLQWGENAQMRLNDHQVLHFGPIKVPAHHVDLAVEPSDDESLLIHFIADAANSTYRLTIAEELPGGYSHQHVAGSAVALEIGRDRILPIEDYLTKDPLIIRYADGTYSYNCYLIPLALEAGDYKPDAIEFWDWEGVPLNRESMGRALDQDTIQFRTFEALSDDYEVIFNDDGCGEAADLVCLRDGADDEIVLCLVHCKGAHGGRVSKDIRNFYALCGQAQKSITAKHAGLKSLYLDLKRRQETWQRLGSTRFLKGDLKKLAYFKDKSRKAKVKFEVVLVQPGASASDMNPDALKLLGTTELYLKKTTEADVRVITSA